MYVPELGEGTAGLEALRLGWASSASREGTTPGAVVLVGSEDVVKNGIGVLDKGGSWTSGQRGKKMKIKKSRTKLDPCQIILGLRHRKGRDPEAVRKRTASRSAGN